MHTKRKALTAQQVTEFLHIPNVGPATVQDFNLLGLKDPAALRACDPFELYERLCVLSGIRHDLCVIDVFWAAIDFMNGAPARPWWFYTPLRKERLRS